MSHITASITIYLDNLIIWQLISFGRWAQSNAVAIKGLLIVSWRLLNFHPGGTVQRRRSHLQIKWFSWLNRVPIKSTASINFTIDSNILAHFLYIRIVLCISMLQLRWQFSHLAQFHCTIKFVWRKKQTTKFKVRITQSVNEFSCIGGCVNIVGAQTNNLTSNANRLVCPVILPIKGCQLMLNFP